MRRKGSDQGGRWPVGIWFALVGMSAGTVGSFSLIGWTFAKGLYDVESGGEPLEFDPETVIIEAEEPPEGDGEGAAGGDDELDGPTEPGNEPDIAASPAEPRTGRVEEAPETREDVPEAPPAEEPREEHHEVEEIEPPHLVPVEDDDEDDYCDPDESAHRRDGRGDDAQETPDDGHDEGHGRHEDPYLQPLFEDLDLDLDIDPDIDLDLDLDLDLLD